MDSMTTTAFVVRCVAAFAASAILVWLGLHHADGGLKGAYIPLPNLAVCIVVAATAGIVCTRAWSAIAAPALAGIAGVFGIGGQLYGPFGGIVGLLVGLIVVLVPFPWQISRERRH